MGGMISNEIVALQGGFVDVGSCSVLLNSWTQRLVVWLLKAAHGQSLYWNVHVHDTITGVEVQGRKKHNALSRTSWRWGEMD